MEFNQQPANLSLGDQIAAAQLWWHDAGVDCAYTDDPKAWLGEEPAAQDAKRGEQNAQAAPPPKLAAPLRLGSERGGASQTEEPVLPALGGDPAQWPQTLAEFQQWWRGAPSLQLVPGAARPAPRGTQGAALMIIVPMPEQADSETVLSAIEGQLIRNMVLAMGWQPDSAYVAAALPCHMAEPDWDGLATRGLGRLLHHHVNLVRPDRLLVLGNRILPLLGHDPAQGPAKISETAIQGQQSESSRLPTLASYAPEHLLRGGRTARDLWERWLIWPDRN